MRTTLPTTGTLNRGAAFVLFIAALAAFVIQSSFTQYVQSDLGFRQPFFLLYFVHTSFILLFPLHMLYLKIFTKTPLHTYISSLHEAIRARLTYPGDLDTDPFPTRRLLFLIAAFTAGINIPGLLWYIAVSLASISDVTALWNTNSFWVYVLCVWIYRMKLEPRKLGAVLFASAGVLLVVYGGTRTTAPDPDDAKGLESIIQGPPWPIVGDLLTFIASISYALLQVMYKHYIALADDPEAAAVPTGPTEDFPYRSLAGDEESTPSIRAGLLDHGVKADPPPFGLYPNLFTSCLGLSTALTFVWAFPVLHWTSIETFRLPPDAHTFWCIVGIAAGGLVFNASFLILLGVWGPILTSIGSLLTIVLVLITDILFSHSGVTLWGILGAGMIVSAFGVLAFDMMPTK
ncbi:hypothetical protein M422DRAFT_30005 [Sphaerobolus stellatus SS14]|uniref:EamA domain-containing protein n=1 Tax=Sphaerobolus stellatus (strain SS14) TaxID=990650 RepID=A0A0C9VRV0_SPHS4|nr:hypothetical protein M422DRAFT_30005 [Sphaerobolus stellatus SS14]